MKKLLILSIIYICTGLFLGSCDPSSTYVYTIYNDSVESLYISLYNPDLSNHAELESINACNFYHYIKIEDKDTIFNERPIAEVELRPHEKIKFIEYVEMSAYIQDDPENESRVVWGPYSCILQMSRDKNIIDDMVWRDKHNWIKVKQKKRFVEFALIVE